MDAILRSITRLTRASNNFESNAMPMTFSVCIMMFKNLARITEIRVFGRANDHKRKSAYALKLFRINEIEQAGMLPQFVYICTTKKLRLHTCILLNVNFGVNALRKLGFCNPRGQS